MFGHVVQGMAHWQEFPCSSSSSYCMLMNFQFYQVVQLPKVDVGHLEPQLLLRLIGVREKQSSIGD